MHALPHAWVLAAAAATGALATGQLHQPPQLREALDVLLPRLGWPRAGDGPLLVAQFTVRDGTALLKHADTLARQTGYLAPYAALAIDAAAGPVPAVLRLFQRRWRLRWGNERKVTFWRLVYDALPTAARLHTIEPCLCGTGPPSPDRHHHFWACPVARAVVDSISAAVGAPVPPSGWAAPSPQCTPACGMSSAWPLSKPWTAPAGACMPSALGPHPRPPSLTPPPDLLLPASGASSLILLPSAACPAPGRHACLLTIPSSTMTPMLLFSAPPALVPRHSLPPSSVTPMLSDPSCLPP